MNESYINTVREIFIWAIWRVSSYPRTSLRYSVALHVVVKYEIENARYQINCYIMIGLVTEHDKRFVK